MVNSRRAKIKTLANPSVHVCETASGVRAIADVVTVATSTTPRMNSRAKENPRKTPQLLKEKQNEDEATHRLASP